MKFGGVLEGKKGLDSLVGKWIIIPDVWHMSWSLVEIVLSNCNHLGQEEEALIGKSAAVTASRISLELGELSFPESFFSWFWSSLGAISTITTCKS
jgi:hypothetical protein